jgi:hypothetical protein
MLRTKEWSLAPWRAMLGPPLLSREPPRGPELDARVRDVVAEYLFRLAKDATANRSRGVARPSRRSVGRRPSSSLATSASFDTIRTSKRSHVRRSSASVTSTAWVTWPSTWRST